MDVYKQCYIQKIFQIGWKIQVNVMPPSVERCGFNHENAENEELSLYWGYKKLWAYTPPIPNTIKLEGIKIFIFERSILNCGHIEKIYLPREILHTDI